MFYVGRRPARSRTGHGASLRALISHRSRAAVVRLVHSDGWLGSGLLLPCRSPGRTPASSLPQCWQPASDPSSIPDVSHVPRWPAEQGISGPHCDGVCRSHAAGDTGATRPPAASFSLLCFVSFSIDRELTNRGGLEPVRELRQLNRMVSTGGFAADSAAASLSPGADSGE